MDRNNVPVVTVDGPSGVGKGTISQLLAKRLGWHFLDSGALYRLTALAARRHGVALDDEEALSGLAGSLDVRFEAGEHGGTALVFLENRDVTDDIRKEECGSDASVVAALLPVREALLQRQRAFRRSPGLVADGRDMGTAVFPDAPAKIFLTASPEVRAERRYNQLKQKGLDVNLPSLLREIAERDERDSNRSASPLRPAEDAIVIDTSELGVQDVFEQVMSAIAEKIEVD
ncbi:(d)CMP kinase [Thiohalomonas denitrificans]|uniref:Cytidylate kinase n=1 Tax=Thiohalomonas denitrificans TaxID=415747 RepID=A0A1G5PI52_9GAMM|nr:(d)CMP kinase [Thiohalomonas denitrificans]SCZ49202.1 cytidylate kinase [Thiohalomonas denitrificans]